MDQGDNDKSVVRLEGVVISVVGYNISMSHTPISEAMVGGKSPRYNTGERSKLEIEIDCNDTPARTIEFHGSSPVRRGDQIKAYIGEENNVTIYIKIYNGRDLVRTDYSVDYNP